MQLGLFLSCFLPSEAMDWHQVCCWKLNENILEWTMFVSMNSITLCVCNGASNSPGIQITCITAPSYVGTREKNEKQNTRAGE